MFIAIFIAILLTAGLYFLMKPKKSQKSPEDIAKARIENLLKSYMRQMEMAVKDPSSAPPDIGLAQEAMISTHQEFGIAVSPPPGIMDQIERGDQTDIDNVVFTWKNCPKNFSIGDCWEN